MSGNPLEIIGDVPVGMNINFNDFASAVETKLWGKIGKVNWRPFEEARNYARALKIKSQTKWYDFARTKNKPADIPYSPSQTYEEFISWPDWLNNGNDRIEYWPFEKVREYVRKLELVNGNNEWLEYCQSGQKPAEIPYDVRGVYKRAGLWTNDPDFFRGAVARQDIDFLSYEDAKKTFVHPLKLSGEQAWRDYKKDNELPLNIPQSPEAFYKEWAGWPDWVGSGLISNRQKSENFVSFNEAKAWTIKQNITGQKQWIELTKSPDFPVNIPKNPRIVYKGKGWVGEPDFFGYETISGPHKKFRDFSEAQTFAQTLGLSLRYDWQKWLKKGKRPHDIPAKPNVVYKDKGWNGWTDFLKGDK
jgi:hypothetical protein